MISRTSVVAVMMRERTSFRTGIIGYYSMDLAVHEGAPTEDVSLITHINQRELQPKK